MATATETPTAPVTTREDRIYGPETASTPEVAPAPASAPEKVKPAESEPAKPSEAAPPAETAPESEPGTTTEEQKPALSDEERSKRDKAHTKRTITNLNREVGAARAEAKRLQEEIASLRKGKPEDAPGRPEANGTEPRLEDYDNVDAWKRDFATFQRQQALAEFEQNRRQEEQERETTKIASTWSEKLGSYLKRNPGIDPENPAEEFEQARASVKSVVGDSPLNRKIAMAAFESEVGPDMIVYVAEHEVELKKLAQMSEWAQDKFLVTLENTLTQGLKRPATPPTLRAPRAPSTVSGTGAGSAPRSREDKFYPNQKD